MKKKLLFVSPRFLFPADSGGKIRTSQILRGLRGGAFEITLTAPATTEMVANHRKELEAVSDRFVSWPEPQRGIGFRLQRIVHLASALPVSVAADRSRAARRVISGLLDQGYNLVIFDFVHSAVLAPQRLPCPSVLFTHNVETEIFARHRDVASNPLSRWLWANQEAKMARFEASALSAFDGAIAVAQRDADQFRERFGIDGVEVIPTGTDVGYYHYQRPADSTRVVFTGSMDWAANIDGIRFLLDEVWPDVQARQPAVEMLVVGRNPPTSLVQRAQSSTQSWSFTGRVPDVRPYVHQSSVYVIPLRVGGGTRIKAFEAMAMGCPIVSTALGVEGLGLVPGQHYLEADSPKDFAGAILELLRDPELRKSISLQARRFVEENCTCDSVARRFEEICLRALGPSDGSPSKQPAAAARTTSVR
jgi:glycosyltransferase involved in cell wall biosynthesis